MTDNKLLQSALAADFENRIPADTEQPHCFSKRYRSRQRDLVIKHASRKKLSVAAKLLIAAVLGVVMATAFVGGYSFGGFTVIMHGSSAEIINLDINKSSIQQTCRFTNPDALPATGERINDNRFSRVYCIDSKALNLHQYTASAAKKQPIEGTLYPAETVEGFFVKEYHCCTLYWEQEGYLLSLGGNYSMDELEEFALQVVFD